MTQHHTLFDDSNRVCGNFIENPNRATIYLKNLCRTVKQWFR